MNPLGLCILALFHGLTDDRTTTLLKGAGAEIEVISKSHIRVVVGKSASRFGDKETEVLKKVKGLVELILTNGGVTDQGFAHIASIKTLRVLNIRNSKITDRGLEAISQCEMLERLNIL